MPIVQNKIRPTPPNSPNVPQTDRPGAQAVRHMHKAYRGVTVDTTYTPRQNLIMHVEGSPWSVNYYSQMIGMDDATQGQGLGTLAIHQQYKLVKKLEIRVQSPLSPSQNSETKEMIYTGSAIVYPFVIPNEGDVFLADIGDGQEGVFQVTSSERKSIYREACHEIEYKLIDYSNNGRVEDLDKKTVQVFHFERDFIKHGHNPLLFENVFNDYIVLRDAYPRIVELYLRRFYSQEFTTLCVPDRPEYTYDPFHTAAFNSHFGRWDTNHYKHIRILNADEDPAMKAFSLWDAIAHRDRASLNSAFRRFGLVDVTQFERKSYYDGIRFSGFKKTIYPQDPMPNAQYGLGWSAKNVEPFIRMVRSGGIRRISDFMSADLLNSSTREIVYVDKYPGYPDNPVWVPDAYGVVKTNDESGEDNGGNNQGGNQPTPLPGQSPIIHPAMSDGYYIFSKAFWENDRTPGAQSKFELIYQDYFDKKAISYERIKEVYTDSLKWNALDSFYYLPLLLVMMKVVVLTV